MSLLNGGHKSIVIDSVVVTWNESFRLASSRPGSLLVHDVLVGVIEIIILII
jgi:hypothetical protein